MYLMLPSQKNRCGPGNAVPISSHVGFEMLKKKGVYLGNYPCGSNTINKYIYILYIYTSHYYTIPATQLSTHFGILQLLQTSMGRQQLIWLRLKLGYTPIDRQC